MSKRFSPIVRESVPWLEVKEWAEKRLAMYRIKNDSGDTSELETARLRGRIAELKDLLAMGEEPKGQIE